MGLVTEARKGNGINEKRSTDRNLSGDFGGDGGGSGSVGTMERAESSGELCEARRIARGTAEGWGAAPGSERTGDAARDLFAP